MIPVFRAFIAALLLVVLVHSVHVHCFDFTVRPNNGTTLEPNDYLLNFVNNYNMNFAYRFVPLQLRCYAILYYTKKPTTVEIAQFDLKLNQNASLGFNVRPHTFRYGWRIQCDYRYLVASSLALKQGDVLLGGSSSQRCLNRNGGCDVVFKHGEARRYSRSGGSELLGALPVRKCQPDNFLPCQEIIHPRRMFGNYCEGNCRFRCTVCSRPPDDGY